MACSAKRAQPSLAAQLKPPHPLPAATHASQHSSHERPPRLPGARGEGWSAPPDGTSHRLDDSLVHGAGSSRGRALPIADVEFAAACAAARGGEASGGAECTEGRLTETHATLTVLPLSS